MTLRSALFLQLCRKCPPASGFEIGRCVGRGLDLIWSPFFLELSVLKKKIKKFILISLNIRTYLLTIYKIFGDRGMFVLLRSWTFFLIIVPRWLEWGLTCHFFLQIRLYSIIKYSITLFFFSFSWYYMGWRTYWAKCGHKYGLQDSLCRFGFTTGNHRLA